MDPVNPWLDPSEVRHLAERLLRPVPPAGLNAADPGFNASFVGFISAGEATTAREADAPPPTVRPKPPVPEPSLPVSQPAAEPPAALSRTRFLERIHIFRDWLAKNFHATGIFILDSEGEVIFDESGHGRLHFIARSFTIASSGAGNVHIKVGPGAILEVIPCGTHRGRIVLGALVPDALPASQVLTITEALIQTASPA